MLYKHLISILLLLVCNQKEIYLELVKVVVIAHEITILPRLLLSLAYAREDSKHAERLDSELKKARFKPWLDKHNLVAGQDWKERLWMQ